MAHYELALFVIIKVHISNEAMLLMPIIFSYLKLVLQANYDYGVNMPSVKT